MRVCGYENHDELVLFASIGKYYCNNSNPRSVWLVVGAHTATPKLSICADFPDASEATGISQPTGRPSARRDCAEKTSRCGMRLSDAWLFAAGSPRDY